MEELSKEQIKQKIKKENKKKILNDNDKSQKNDKLIDTNLPSKIDEIKIILLSIASFYFNFISFKDCEGAQSLITLYIIYEVLKKKASKVLLFYYIPLLIYLLYFHDKNFSIY